MDLTFFGNPEMTHIAGPFNPLPMLTKGYGIGYDNGKISFWEWPGDRNIGDYYQNRFFLVNLDSGKKIEINITVVFVEEILRKAEIVGELSLNIPTANIEGTDYAITEFGLETILEELGCSNTESLTWKAYNQLGQLITGEEFDEMYGFGFDKEGKATTNEAEQIFFVGYSDGEFHSFVKDPTLRKDVFTTILIAEYNGKAYKFVITLSNTIKNSIFRLDNDKQTDTGNTIYDLSGRKVNSVSKGIYIINGKKVAL